MASSFATLLHESFATFAADKKERMIMGHCSCCAHTHECAPEKHIEKKESIFAEYWKVVLSFIMLISGIIMNALELPFFREGYFSLIWYVVAYLPVGLPVMKEAWELSLIHI